MLDIRLFKRVQARRSGGICGLPQLVKGDILGEHSPTANAARRSSPLLAAAEDIGTPDYRMRRAA